MEFECARKDENFLQPCAIGTGSPDLYLLTVIGTGSPDLYLLTAIGTGSPDLYLLTAIGAGYQVRKDVVTDGTPFTEWPEYFFLFLKYQVGVPILGPALNQMDFHPD